MTTTRTSSPATEFELRARRAELLADIAPAAAEPLRFVAGLCRAQGTAVARIEALDRGEPLAGVLGRDLARVLAHVREIARFAAHAAPPSLAHAAASRCDEDDSTARSRLEHYWTGSGQTLDDYLSRAMLRPYAEALRALERPIDRRRERAHCPVCGGAPIVGCRRGGGVNEGGARFLACGSCGLEWPIRRILCPACHEGDPHKLPAFTSTDHPLARIEACETCRRYVKSLDLSQDARPIPEIDDLASLALDLWAHEQGFSRLEPGLAGV